MTRKATREELLKIHPPKPRHTPGPWLVNDEFEVVSQDTGYVISTHDQGGEESSEEQANARLIALAPEMLEALKDIQHGLPGVNARALAASLVRKAEGGGA